MHDREGKKKCSKIPRRKGKGRDGSLELYPPRIPGTDSASVQLSVRDVTDRVPSHQQNITLMSILNFRGQVKGIINHRALSFPRMCL